MEQRIVCRLDNSHHRVRERADEAWFMEAFARVLGQCGQEGIGDLKDEAILRAFVLVTLWPSMQRSLERQLWRQFTSLTGSQSDVRSNGEQDLALFDR
jgi:hypothetical protein